ncbi:MAG: hypothetical protein GY774_19870 [Planctomycetes bacterium]|nr:hypothetical protein [Planctomycetota bacterium]
MKNRIVLVTLLLLLAAGLVQAEDEDKLGVTLDLSYWSKWLSKGFSVYGQQGGLFKTIDVDLYGTGFGVKVTHRNATSSGYVNGQRFDYRPYYKSTLFKDETYATNYNLSVGYEHYTGLDRHKAPTTYEWILALSWPDIMPNGIVPKYIVHYEYPASSGDTFRTGWVHRFGLGKNIEVDILPQALHISGEIAYTDGLGAKTVDHDWSFATFGLSTKFILTDNLTFVPCVYHQITMDKSINPDKDLTYAVLSMKYKF